MHPARVERKIGIMVSAAPASPEFTAGVAAAERALGPGSQVYLYLIDSAVEGISDPRFAEFKSAGGHLYACAYSLQRRGLNPPGAATLSGLTVLSDIMSSTEEFQSYN
jgi:hypothetical protein